MAADYMRMASVPDRIYKRFALLFNEADRPLLEVIERIAAAKISLGCPYVFVSQSVRQPDKTDERFYEVQDGHVFLLLEGVNEPMLQAACDLLTRAGLMSHWFVTVHANA